MSRLSNSVELSNSKMSGFIEAFTGQQMALLNRLVDMHGKKPAPEDTLAAAQAKRHSKKIGRSHVTQPICKPSSHSETQTARS